MSNKRNIVKWLNLSVCKHFTDKISGLHIFVEGQERRTNQYADWCELRIDGPIIRELSKNNVHYYVEVNALVATFIDTSNLARESDNIGKVVSAFENIIVYKYGSGKEDNGDQLGCLTLLPTDNIKEGVSIFRFGQIDPSLNLLQTTVEGHYEMFLNE